MGGAVVASGGRGGEASGPARQQGGLQTSCMKVWSAAAAAYCCLLLTLAAVPPPYSFLQANTCLFSFLPFRRQKIRLLEALEADGFRLNGTVEGDYAFLYNPAPPPPPATRCAPDTWEDVEDSE